MVFFLFNFLPTMLFLILGCFVLCALLLFCIEALKRLSLAKFYFKTSNVLKAAAAGGFCIHTWTTAFLLEAALFVLKTSIFLTTGALFVCGSLVVATPILFLMSHAHSFKEIPDNFFYSFTRELSELKWSQYYAMLDSALRPYFTLSDEFYKNCEICHLYKENFDMDFKLVEINKNAALNADTTPSASVKVEEKKRILCDELLLQ